MRKTDILKTSTFLKRKFEEVHFFKFYFQENRSFENLKKCTSFEEKKAQGIFREMFILALLSSAVFCLQLNELIKHCIQLPSNEGFKNAKYLLEKVYGNPHEIPVSYRREIKQWPQIKFGDVKGFRKFHNFLLKCRSVFASQR